MNPFQQMASALSRKSPPDVVRDRNAKSAFVMGTGCYGARRNGNTDKAREALQNGPATAKEIADMCGLKSSGTVMALLRHDVRKGVVLVEDGLYRWNYDYDILQAEEVRNAVKLLKRFGYKVSK